MVTTVQGHQDYAIATNRSKGQRFSANFIKEKVKEEVAAPEKPAESPGCCLKRAWGAEYSSVWWKVVCAYPQRRI